MHRLLAAFLVLSLGTPAHATCAMVPLTTKVSSATEAPEGGGLVVATTHDGPKPKGGGWNPVNPAWRFRAGGKLHVPVIESLAPGLAIYRLPAGVTSAELVDGKTVLGRITIKGPKLAPLAAPKVKTLHQTMQSSRKGMSIEMFAELGEDMPAGAIGLVVADAKGTPRSYGSSREGRTMLVYSHYPCSQDPTGAVQSSDGEELQLYWVDRAGQKSPATKMKLKATFIGRNGPVDL
jgi:hypothetical protein